MWRDRHYHKHAVFCVSAYAFTNTAGDGSKKTLVVCGSEAPREDLRELELEPEPEPEPVSGFSLEVDEAGAGSAYGALSSPGIRERAGAGICNAACRISVAISRLPPFATPGGDMSGVIGTPGGRASSGGTSGGSMTKPPTVGVVGGRQAGELEQRELPTRNPQSNRKGTAAGFTIQEGTVLPSPSSASLGRSVQKKLDGGGSGGGLSESLLS